MAEAERLARAHAVLNSLVESPELHNEEADAALGVVYRRVHALVCDSVGDDLAAEMAMLFPADGDTTQSAVLVTALKGWLAGMINESKAAEVQGTLAKFMGALGAAGEEVADEGDDHEVVDYDPPGYL